MRNPTTEASICRKIDLAVTETNTAYSLSDAKVVLNIVLVAFDDYAKTDDMVLNLTDLQARPSVHALREA